MERRSILRGCACTVPLLQNEPEDDEERVEGAAKEERLDEQINR